MNWTNVPILGANEFENWTKFIWKRTFTALIIPQHYSEFHLLANLGWVDLDLGSSPGWWAGTVASYFPSRMVELPKSKSTHPRFASMQMKFPVAGRDENRNCKQIWYCMNIYRVVQKKDPCLMVIPAWCRGTWMTLGCGRGRSRTRGRGRRGQTSAGRRCRGTTWRACTAAGNCVEIGLPGKLILGD